MPYSFVQAALQETGIQSTTTPEIKLMWAVLVRAVKDLMKDNVSPLDRNSAIRWIFSEGNHYIFSFESLCLHLDIDPAHLRAKIRELYTSAGGSRKTESQPSLLLLQEVNKSSIRPNLNLIQA